MTAITSQSFTFEPRHATRAILESVFISHAKLNLASVITFSPTVCSSQSMITLLHTLQNHPIGKSWCFGLWFALLKIRYILYMRVWLLHSMHWGLFKFLWNLLHMQTNRVRCRDYESEMPNNNLYSNYVCTPDSDISYLVLSLHCEFL